MDFNFLDNNDGYWTIINVSTDNTCMSNVLPDYSGDPISIPNQFTSRINVPLTGDLTLIIEVQSFM